MKPLLVLSYLCLVLVGCSNTGHLQNQAPIFQTLITHQGIKRFEVSVLPKPIDPLRSINTNDGQDSASHTEHQQRRTDLYLRAELKAVLEKSGFCREGYLLLGRFAGQSQYRLRGECKDLANAEDRLRFPDTIARW